MLLPLLLSSPTSATLTTSINSITLLATVSVPVQAQLMSGGTYSGLLAIYTPTQIASHDIGNIELSATLAVRGVEAELSITMSNLTLTSVTNEPITATLSTSIGTFILSNAVEAGGYILQSSLGDIILASAIDIVVSNRLSKSIGSFELLSNVSRKDNPIDPDSIFPRQFIQMRAFGNKWNVVKTRIKTVRR